MDEANILVNLKFLTGLYYFSCYILEQGGKPVLKLELGYDVCLFPQALPG